MEWTSETPSISMMALATSSRRPGSHFTSTTAKVMAGSPYHAGHAAGGRAPALPPRGVPAGTSPQRARALREGDGVLAGLEGRGGDGLAPGHRIARVLVHQLVQLRELGPSLARIADCRLHRPLGPEPGPLVRLVGVELDAGLDHGVGLPRLQGAADGAVDGE